MPESRFLIEREDALAKVVINRPEKRNAFNLAMWTELTGIIKDLDSDSGIRVIIITGAGDQAFAAGADVSEMKGGEYPPRVDGKAFHPVATTTATIERSAKPVIAMINGYAIGGGCELAVACDLRVAADTAKIGITSAKIGICISRNDIRMLVELVGPSRAKDILFTGRLLSAREALSIGLVDHVVPREQLDSYTMDMARGIANNAPLSVFGAKRTINLLKGLPDVEGADDPFYYSRLCFESEDFREGVSAFLERRRPRFKGR